MFVGATMPRPRNDIACDNSLIPPWAYTSSFDPNLLDLRAAGRATTRSPRSRTGSGCLNPPPIPPASPTDAHFLVTPRGSASPPQVAPTITIGGDPNGTTQKVRLTGNWFVDAIAAAGRRIRPWQSADPRLHTTGTASATWPGCCRDEAGNADTSSAPGPRRTAPRSTPTPARPTAPAGSADHIEYVGDRRSPVLRQHRAVPVRHRDPDVLAERPARGQPGHLLGRRLRAGRAPTTTRRLLLALPAAGVRLDRVRPHRPGRPDAVLLRPVHRSRPSRYTWESIGPAKVELTATDQHGHSATTVFVVNVGNVAPTALALHENATTVGHRGDPARRGRATSARTTTSTSRSTSATACKKSTKVGPNSDTALSTPRSTGSGSARRRATASWRGTPTPSRASTTAPTRCPTGAAAPTSTPSSSGSPGQQKITFPAVDDHEYGDQVTMDGHRHGVRHARSPTPPAPADGLRRPPVTTARTIKLVGVGACTVTAHQAEYLPVFLRGGRRLALLRGHPGRPDDHRRRPDAGSTAPTPRRTPPPSTGWPTATRRPTSATIAFTGAPADAGVGEYDITASGASEPELRHHLRHRHREGHPGAADDHRRRQDPRLRRGLPGLHRVVRRVRQRRRRGRRRPVSSSPAARPPEPMSATTPITGLRCDEPQLRHRPTSPAPRTSPRRR